MMIKMGQAAAYDFKVLATTLCIISFALVAASRFGQGQDPESAARAANGPKLSLGGG